MLKNLRNISLIFALLQGTIPFSVANAAENNDLDLLEDLDDLEDLEEKEKKEETNALPSKPSFVLLESHDGELNNLLLKINNEKISCKFVDEQDSKMLLHLKAARLIYNDGLHEFSGFKLIDSLEFDGFKVGVFDHQSLDRRIVAFRGTTNLNNWYFNAFHICASHAYEHMLSNIMIGVFAVGIGSSLMFGKSGMSSNSLKLSIFSLGLMIKDRIYNNRKGFEQFVRANFFYEAVQKMNCFVELYVGNSDKKVDFTGHSLGGFFAQHYALKYDLDGTAYNAPALGNYDTNSEIKNGYSKNFLNFRIEGDIVSTGTFMPPLGLTKTCPLMEFHGYTDASPVIRHSLENFYRHLYQTIEDRRMQESLKDKNRIYWYGEFAQLKKHAK